jgi:hypothetical protein
MTGLALAYPSSPRVSVLAVGVSPLAGIVRVLTDGLGAVELDASLQG